MTNDEIRSNLHSHKYDKAITSDIIVVTGISVENVNVSVGYKTMGDIISANEMSFAVREIIKRERDTESIGVEVVKVLKPILGKHIIVYVEHMFDGYLCKRVLSKNGYFVEEGLREEFMSIVKH